MNHFELCFSVDSNNTSLYELPMMLYVFLLLSNFLHFNNICSMKLLSIVNSQNLLMFVVFVLFACCTHQKSVFVDKYIWRIQYIIESKGSEKSVFLRFITAKKANIFEHIKSFLTI